jgi:hypothetical protein
MMWCMKCDGRVFIDQVFSENNHIELFCISCGKRWMVEKAKGAFGAWLDKKARATI